MVEDDDEQFQRLLKLCCFLTIACISLFFYIIYSLRRIIRSALVEYKSREFPKPPIEYFVPLTSPGAITGIFHNTSTNCVDLALSVHPEVTMFVLRNTPLMAFHNAMLAMSNDFFHFLQSSATEEIESVPQNLSLKLTSQEICPSEYRHAYDLVIAFTDKSALVRDAEDERVAISFYMIHVKQHEGSSRPTGILYAYCKTNQDRLICVRKLFTSGDYEKGGSKWPECVICLEENSANVFFVPCLHVAVCKTCLPRFQASPKYPLCPVCRAVIREVKVLE